MQLFGPLEASSNVFESVSGIFVISKADFPPKGGWTKNAI